MRKYYIFSLFLFFSVSYAAEDPIPLTQLPSYFQIHGISYQSFGNFLGTTSDSATTTSYKFLNYPDPGDEETIGIFFEVTLWDGLSDDENLHLAVGLRGPVDMSVSGDPLTIVRGRGFALGQLWTESHPGCYVEGNNGPTPGDIRGFFIEDFTAAAENYILGEELEDAHLTECEPVLLPDYTTYRVDLHVSRLNVYVAIWKKNWNFPFSPSYELVVEASCLDEGRVCEERNFGDFDDSGTGNGFITVAASPESEEHPPSNWNVTNIIMALWDS